MTTTSVMEATKQYLSGFRVPDFKKMWYGATNDAVDDAKPAKPLLIQFEAYLVRLQELSLWTDPKNSTLAILVVHLIYWYLSVTSNTAVYILATLAMVSFLYTTWTQRIWPEIRVPEANVPEPDWTPVSPDVLSAPELVKLWDDLKAKLLECFTYLKALRQREPGKFCALMSSVFLTLAYVGSCITTLGLFYYLSMGYLTIPGVMKVLVKYPAVQCMLETMEEMKKKEPETTKKQEVEKVEPAAPSLVDSVYATLQSGINVVSNLNLKRDVEAFKATDEEDSYLPEETEANQSILESAMNSSCRDPTQAHNLEHEEVADSSLEYASLLPVSGNVMPDDEDELDSAKICSTLPLTKVNKEDYDDDEDEFLPPVADQPPSLTKLVDEDEEDEDEFTASLMAAAAAKDNFAASELINEEVIQPIQAPVIRRRKSTSPHGSDLDDFEMISEEELAEVSP